MFTDLHLLLVVGIAIYAQICLACPVILQLWVSWKLVVGVILNFKLELSINNWRSRNKVLKEPVLPFCDKPDHAHSDTKKEYRVWLVFDVVL